MTDWADEIAEKIRRETEVSHDCGYNVEIEGIAAALRKAKADGYRELANRIKGALDENIDKLKQPFLSLMFDIVDLSNEQADETEQGERTP